MGARASEAAPIAPAISHEISNATGASHESSADFAARVKAWERVLAALKCEPMSAQQLADLFGVGRNKVAELLAKIPGAEKGPGGWRVPIAHLPPSYHVSVGLIGQRAA